MSIFLTLIYVLTISTHFGREVDIPPITPENAAQVETVSRLQIEGSFAREIDFNPNDGSQLAVAQDDGNVSIWSIPQGELLSSWRVSTEHVRAIRYMPDGERIVTADFEGNVKLWQTATQQLLQVMRVGAEIPLVLDT
ncbi:MAG: hypothetical protein H7175_25205, partial [Burkholderiales bacterium]|nr:hypothetical protein [Anaerolineae bacterium]